MTTIKDLDLAMRSISNVLKEGAETHRKDEWREGNIEKSVSTHFQHIYDHISNGISLIKHIKNRDIIDKCIEEFSHALTRSAFIVQLLEEEKIKRS
jgi:hypothetical protein